ncbi:GGDEF domain-containing protein [Herbaspirillum sp. alder98]|uniref:GGDEF domain-containing protein n=1 Tax=Herbaspirillum sp. alder98 TaxID=2913096 RepID=UPI001CD8E2BB|nr:GGDEF domain-containing protein [Herbaspirillum sp. alder98]MCA1326877.1 GGDEF domain-containing protein [Herbaspirillum sp. alder98]
MDDFWTVGLLSLALTSSALALACVKLKYVSDQRDTLQARLETSLLDNEELKKIALYDHLTGLPNRVLLEDRMHQVIAKSRRAGGQFVVLFLDLDCFKAINDQFGHAAGDFLLTQVAQRLSATMRHQDTIARLGGDEFIVIAETGTASNACSVRDKAAGCFSAPFMVAGKLMQLDASIGHARYPDDGQSLSELLDRADIDMYSGKKAKSADHLGLSTFENP